MKASGRSVDGREWFDRTALRDQTLNNSEGRLFLLEQNIFK